MKIWNCLRPIIEEYTSDDEMKYLDILQEYITEFHNYDIKGDAFRYPVNRKLNLHHEEWTYLDLVNLENRMNEVYNFFSIIDLHICEKRKDETEYYY
ncbi:MAG: hypothetical protein N4A68_05000 [Maledivibacter sp.]|nr:hypothetical protein [Maledivibacter sp.]